MSFNLLLRLYFSDHIVFSFSTAQSESWSNDVQPGFSAQRQGICWIFQSNEAVSIKHNVVHFHPFLVLEMQVVCFLGSSRRGVIDAVYKFCLLLLLPLSWSQLNSAGIGPTKPHSKWWCSCRCPAYGKLPCVMLDLDNQTTWRISSVENTGEEFKNDLLIKVMAECPTKKNHGISY